MTTHFSLEEFLHSDTADSIGSNNYPTWSEVKNLEGLAEVMEKVRTILQNNSITINSGFRCLEVNQAVGGATNSAHLYALACDFVCPGFGTPYDVCKALEPHVKELELDQLIWEYGDWVHLGLTSGPPRYQCLTINNAGTFNGFG